MDNRRIYRTVRMAIKQLFPTEPKGNFARRLTTLAAWWLASSRPGVSSANTGSWSVLVRIFVLSPRIRKDDL